MEIDIKDCVSFYLTGEKSGSGIRPIDGLGLRPAALARFRDLAGLRYDYPLILTDSSPLAPAIPLSGLFDRILAETAKGPGADKIRHHALRIERGIRRAVRPGARVSLSSLWDHAASSLGEELAPEIAESLAKLRKSLLADGSVAGCDEGLPADFLARALRVSRDEKTRRIRSLIDRLIHGLNNILKADDANSAAAFKPETLARSMGAGFANEFDFSEMSRLLTSSRPKVALPPARRERIERLVSTLESQRFFPAGPGSVEQDPAGAGYSFVFHSCAGALDAYRERLPRMIELSRAITAARLEIGGKYRDDIHDAMLEVIGDGEIDPADVVEFPAYFIHLTADRLTAEESARMTEIFSAGLAMKVLFQIDDFAAPAAGAAGRAPAFTGARQLAHAAIGTGGVYVLQTTSSHLYRVRDDIVRGLAFEGPALFSLYSGAGGSHGDLDPYLVSAAALESRAFPAFIYDPQRGSDWASRFSIALNPQAELDWPVHHISYEEESLRRASADEPFTIVDFLACDTRYAAHFASVPSGNWDDTMVSVTDAIWDDGASGRVPYVLMVDGENTLHRVIVGRALVREARKSREQWRSLQELGGIHNSHALRLLERELAAWEESARRDAAVRAAKEAAPADAPADTETAPAEASTEPVEKKSSDDPFIETPRCSSCNECIKINDRMFKYDRNKQAYIADPSAGTYAQLVLAAESCQVAIIHPGKPRDPNEPGLEELLKRAEPFR